MVEEETHIERMLYFFSNVDSDSLHKIINPNPLLDRPTASFSNDPMSKIDSLNLEYFVS